MRTGERISGKIVFKLWCLVEVYAGAAAVFSNICSRPQRNLDIAGLGCKCSDRSFNVLFEVWLFYGWLSTGAGHHWGRRIG